MKKLVLILLLVVSFSCQNDDSVTTEAQGQEFSLKVLPGDYPDEWIIYKLKITSRSPFQITSNDFIAKKAYITSIGDYGDIVLLKEDFVPVPFEIISEPGFWFESSSTQDCFIYGTYFYDDENNTMWFEPASAETQALMNQCSGPGSRYAFNHEEL